MNKKFFFGKYKGKLINTCTDYDYLTWCIKKNILKGDSLCVVKKILNLPKDNYKVIVEDSVNNDGEFIVSAYSEKEAIKVCTKTYSIKNTQSFCGTSYKVTKL